MELDLFFKDLKVVELASVLAGPAVGMFFAELGAEVIKIENKNTSGDVTRQWKSSAEDPASTVSAYYHSVNFHKKSLFLDLNAPQDKSVLIEHIKKADMVISNFKPGSAESIGMDYESLKRIKPDIIYGSISAYGPDDPQAGFDALIQAETGWMDINGQSDGPPVKMPVALIDILAAHQLKEGLLVALMHRMKTGEGMHIDTSLYDSAIASLANQASAWLNTSVSPKRMGSQHPNIAPYGDIIVTADHMELLLAIGTDSQFKAFCHIIDRAELSETEMYSANIARVQNRNMLMEILNEASKNYSRDNLLQKCKDARVPVAAINKINQVLSDPKSEHLILDQIEEDGTVSKRVKTAIFKVVE